MTTPCTNNLVEYEAVRKGMELLLEAGAEAVEIFGDSKLVISQLTEEYRCESEALFPIWMQCRELMSRFRYINFQGFGSGGTQKDKTQSHEVCSDRG